MFTAHTEHSTGMYRLFASLLATFFLSRDTQGTRTSFAMRSSLLPAHEDTAACLSLPYPLRHSPWPHIMMCWQDANTFLVHGWFQT